MKRGVLFLSLALLSLPFVSEAQNRNEVTGAMLITTTDTIITHLPPPPPPVGKKPKTKAKAIELKKGYQQEVSFAYSFLSDLHGCDHDIFLHHINFNYVGGYRFNHHIFLGVGSGLDFAGGMNFRPLVLVDFSQQCADIREIGEGDTFDYHLVQYGYLPVQKVSVPLYAHFRVYFLKTKLTPFLAFSAGMRFSASKALAIYDSYYSNYNRSRYEVGHYIRTDSYGAVTGMFEVMPGVSYQFNDKYTFNFQFGYATRSGHEWVDYRGDGDCELQNTWYHGFTMRLGFVF